MLFRVSTMLLVCPWVSVAAGEAPAMLPPPVDTIIDYTRDIKPLLEARCIKCHGERKQESLYRMDSRADVIGSGSERSAIIPGNSEDSLVVKLIAAIDPAYFHMPPKGKLLDPEEVGLIRAWIDQGVVWDAGGAVGPLSGLPQVPFTDLPGEWVAESTASAQAGTWNKAEVAGPRGEPCVSITELAAATPDAMHVLWDQGARISGGTVSVQIKTLSGTLDQGGGLIWPGAGSGVFYVVWCSFLQGNLCFLEVRGDSMEELARATLPERRGDWISLAVQHEGGRIAIHIDGAPLIEREVPAPDPTGGIGLCAKADASTIFTRPLISATSGQREIAPSDARTHE